MAILPGFWGIVKTAGENDNINPDEVPRWQLFGGLGEAGPDNSLGFDVVPDSSSAPVFFYVKIPSSAPPGEYLAAFVTTTPSPEQGNYIRNWARFDVAGPDGPLRPAQSCPIGSD